jgi:hypothetical protein
MKFKTQQPNRLAILQTIFEHLQLVAQWMPNHLMGADYSYRSIEYLQKAEALMELLEVHDCGSVGGFDEEALEKYATPMKPDGSGGKPSSLNFYQRFVWLVDKHGHRPQLKCEGFTVESLGKYFKTVGELRDKMLKV